MSSIYFSFKFIQILLIFLYKIEFFNGFPVQVVQLSQTPQPSSGFLIASQNIGKQLLALPNCQSTCFPPQQTERTLKFPAALLALSPILPVPPELGCAPTNPCPIQSFCRPCCCGCGLNICVRPSCCCRRFGAEEEKYKSSPHIRPVTKTTLKTSTNGISSSENGTSTCSKTSSKTEESLKTTENGSSGSSKTEESLKNYEEDKTSETAKPKTKIIKKKIVKKPATTASNGTTPPNKIQEKSELTKSTTSNLKQSDNNDNKVESVPRTYQIVITLSDYLADEEEGEEEEPFGLDEGQCVEVLDNANPDAWLVRTKTKPPSIGFVPGSYFTSPTKYYALQREACSIAKLLKTEEEFIGELKLALDYYGKGLVDDQGGEESEVPQAVKERNKELLVSNLESLHDFHSKELDNALRLCQHVDNINKFLEEIRAKQTNLKPYSDYLQLIPTRMRYYEDFFKELINKNQNCTEEMKASLNFIQLLEQRAKEPDYTTKIVGYSGDIGRVYRNELFQVWEDGENNKDCGDKYVFLLNNTMIITDKEEANGEISFKHYASVKLSEYSPVRQHSTEASTLVVAPTDFNKNLPTYLLRIRQDNAEESEIVRRVWINDICSMHRAFGG
uniref:Uncharacterized protein n=1 Tax=Meloidogyne floridensis TaxID=298350 RepID=A0A915NV71_9BILA